MVVTEGRKFQKSQRWWAVLCFGALTQASYGEEQEDLPLELDGNWWWWWHEGRVGGEGAAQLEMRQLLLLA